MLIGAIIAFCIVLLVLAFLFPRLSRHPERAGQKVVGTGGRAAGHAPGKLGRWLSKPFSSSIRAISKSGSAGRRGRARVD
jgi:hypothetical protein